MIFILSLIIGFGSLILCPIIFILNDYSIGLEVITIFSSLYNFDFFSDYIFILSTYC